MNPNFFSIWVNIFLRISHTEVVRRPRVVFLRQRVHLQPLAELGRVLACAVVRGGSGRDFLFAIVAVAVGCGFECAVRMAQAKGVIIVLLKNGHTLVEHRAHRAEVVGYVILHGVTAAATHNAAGRETGAFKTCIVATANVEHRSANVGKAAIVGWVAY